MLYRLVATMVFVMPLYPQFRRGHSFHSERIAAIIRSPHRLPYPQTETDLDSSEFRRKDGLGDWVELIQNWQNGFGHGHQPIRECS